MANLGFDGANGAPLPGFGVGFSENSAGTLEFGDISGLGGRAMRFQQLDSAR